MRRGAALRGITTAPSRFGFHRPALWLGPRQITHTRRDDAEVRLTRGVMRRMRDVPLADKCTNMTQLGSPSIIVYLRTTSDADPAIDGLRIAIRANPIRR